MSTRHKEQTRKMFLEVVNTQIRDNNPPETKQTLDRLISEGFSEKEAKQMIACVAVSEIYNVLQKKQEFDLTRYIAALNRLPQQCQT